MFLLVLSPTSLGKHVAVGWILLLMFLLSLIYFAGADALYWRDSERMQRWRRSMRSPRQNQL